MDYGLSAFSECFACLEKKFQVWFVCWPNTSPLLYISISHIAVTSVMDTGIYWYLRQDCGKYFIVGKWKYLVQIKISLKWAEWPSSTASRYLLSTHWTQWWCVLESADNYSWSLEMLSPSKGEPLWPAGTFTAAAAAPWPEWRPSNYGSSIIGSKHYVGHQYWKKYLYLYTSRKWHNYNQAQLNVFIENLFCCVCFPMCSKKEVLLVSIVARARWCWWEHLVSFLLCCVTHSEYYLHYYSREDPIPIEYAFNCKNSSF